MIQLCITTNENTKLPNYFNSFCTGLVGAHRVAASRNQPRVPLVPLRHRQLVWEMAVLLPEEIFLVFPVLVKNNVVILHIFLTDEI